MKFIKYIIYIITNYSSSLLNGLKNTLIIALLAFVIGLVLGSLIAICRIGSKKENVFLKILDKICAVYVTVIRGTPVVVQLLLMYFGVLALSNLGALSIAIIVFGLNSSAYMSEIIRSGILSVDKGQMEAGRTLGLSYSKTMKSIVFPQAIKNAIPTILNELIALLKETSVAGYITVIDLTMAVQRIVANEYEALVPYTVLAIIYLIIVGILTLGVKAIERRLRRNDSSI